jgi:hypothetical protein
VTVRFGFNFYFLGYNIPMIDPLEPGDDLKKQYLDKALHANDEAVSGSKFTDLINKDSSVYQNPNPVEPREKTVIPEKPKVDAEGFPIIEKVHTFKEDLAGIIKEDSLSLSRIAMMQSGQTNNSESVKKEKIEKTNSIYYVVGIALILVAIGLIGGALVNLGKQQEVVVIPTVEKEKYLIFAERNEELNLSNTTKSEVSATIKSIASKFREEDSVLEIEPILKDVGAESKVTTSTFFDKLGARIPDSLQRTIPSKFFLGLYSKKGRTDPFLLIYTSSYDIAFPALLEWEGYMQDDFDWMFDTRQVSVSGNAPAVFSFKDKIVSNKDVRSFEDEDGRTAFFYSFIDPQTILFAKTSDTMRKVIDRIREAKFQ